MNNDIKISVIVPSYKQGKYIENCILSVVKQDYSNWELIIQDGYSLDETEIICKKYAERYLNIIFNSEPDNGFSDAVNKALKKATGTLCVIQSADDFFAHKSVFKEVLEIYKKEPNLILIAGASIVVNENFELLETQERICKYIPNENVYTLKDHFSQGATFFSLKRASEVNFLFDTEDIVADTHFWIKIACSHPSQFNSIFQTSNIWGGVLVHPEQRSSDFSKFYLGRAKMAIQNISNKNIKYDIKFKKKIANDLIRAGINHFMALNQDYTELTDWYRILNNSPYISSELSLKKRIKLKLKQFVLKNKKFRNDRDVVFNSKTEMYILNNNPMLNIKWF